MPRRVRVEIEGGVYHVYNRAGQGLQPFAEADEAAAFVDLLRETKTRDGFVVFAWAVQQNHYHIALRTGSVPLSRSMRSIQHRFALGHNRRRQVLGPVWQSRYKAKLVEDQRYFDQLMIYIHLNPVTAGVVRDPADYRWSGHRELLGKGRDPVVDVDEALLCFGSTLRSARAAYVRALKGAFEGQWAGDGLDSLAWWQADDDREVQPVDSGPYVDIQGRSTGLERPALGTMEYVEAAVGVLGADLTEVAGKGRRSATVHQRELLAVVGVERYGVAVKALAALLGKSRATVSAWVSRGALKRSTSARFREEVEKLDRGIAGA